MTSGNDTKTTANGRDVTSEIAYLTRALKAPALRDSVGRLADEPARRAGPTRNTSPPACSGRSLPATRTAPRVVSGRPGFPPGSRSRTSTSTTSGR